MISVIWNQLADQKEQQHRKAIFCSLNDHSLGQEVPEKRRTFSAPGLVQKMMMYSHHTANNTDCSTIKLTSRVERFNKELLIWHKLYKGEFRKEKQDNRRIYITIYASKYMCMYM